MVAQCTLTKFWVLILLTCLQTLCHIVKIETHDTQIMCVIIKVIEVDDA